VYRVVVDEIFQLGPLVVSQGSKSNTASLDGDMTERHFGKFEICYGLKRYLFQKEITFGHEYVQYITCSVSLFFPGHIMKGKAIHAYVRDLPQFGVVWPERDKCTVLDPKSFIFPSLGRFFVACHDTNSFQER